MNADLFYQIALTLVPQIGCVQSRILVEQFGSADAIFKARKSTLEKLDGIGAARATRIKQFQNFKRVEEEIHFIEKYRISPLFLNDNWYPRRLLNCYDCPSMLYFRGEADLNQKRIIAVIGTRTHSEYGRVMTEELIKELAKAEVLVLSGLAFGIDTIAHKAALKNELPTVGVLAHGLDTIYPPQNSKVAKQMVAERGGLLTEFLSGTKPDKHNFPTRNRIVAGMADATVVVETDARGGSMITAELANSYNRDVFAFPGKTTDIKSRGCNQLIRHNKASLITSAKDLLEFIGWLPEQDKPKKIQRQLFIELSTNERIIAELLNDQGPLQIDEIYLKAQMTASNVASVLLSLELQGLVSSLPGKTYKLL